MVGYVPEVMFPEGFLDSGGFHRSKIRYTYEFYQLERKELKASEELMRMRNKIND